MPQVIVEFEFGICRPSRRREAPDSGCDPLTQPWNFEHGLLHERTEQIEVDRASTIVSDPMFELSHGSFSMFHMRAS